MRRRSVSERRTARTPPAIPELVRRSGPSTSAVAPEVVGAGAECGGFVVGVEESAAVDREAAAADTGGEAVAEGLQSGDAAIDVGAPVAREAVPVAAGRRAARGER